MIDLRFNLTLVLICTIVIVPWVPIVRGDANYEIGSHIQNQVSTRISGVEGAFAVVATDDIGGIYVAYQSHWAEDNETENMHVYFAYSHDYGKTWSKSFRIDDNGSYSVYCDSPSITIDPSTGHIFVAWKDDRTGVAKVYIDKSTDRGVSFDSDILVYDWTSDYVPTWLPFTVNIDVGENGKLYITWIAYYSENYTDCNILFAHSIDGGLTFSAPTIVNQLEGEARLTHPWIAIDNENALYVAYCRRNSTSSGVYLAKSTDNGISFDDPVKVNDDSTQRYRGGVQVVVSPDEKINAVWTDSRAGDGVQYFDIFYAFSSDGGQSFSQNRRVNDDYALTPPSIHPHFTRGVQGTPSIASDSDSVAHIVWEDFRNFEDDTAYCRDLYYAYSEDGVQFSDNLKVNFIHTDADSVNCADPYIVIDSQDNLFMVYSDAPSGDNDHHQIYFTGYSNPTSTTTGTTITEAISTETTESTTSTHENTRIANTNGMSIIISLAAIMVTTVIIKRMTKH